MMFYVSIALYVKGHACVCYYIYIDKKQTQARKFLCLCLASTVEPLLRIWTPVILSLHFMLILQKLWAVPIIAYTCISIILYSEIRTNLRSVTGTP